MAERAKRQINRINQKDGRDIWRKGEENEREGRSHGQSQQTKRISDRDDQQHEWHNQR